MYVPFFSTQRLVKNVLSSLDPSPSWHLLSHCQSHFRFRSRQLALRRRWSLRGSVTWYCSGDEGDKNKLSFMIIEDDDKNESENHLEHESAFEEKNIMTTDFFRQKHGSQKCFTWILDPSLFIALPCFNLSEMTSLEGQDVTVKINKDLKKRMEHWDTISDHEPRNRQNTRKNHAWDVK